MGQGWLSVKHGLQKGWLLSGLRYKGGEFSLVQLEYSHEDEQMGQKSRKQVKGRSDVDSRHYPSKDVEAMVMDSIEQGEFRSKEEI